MLHFPEEAWISIYFWLKFFKGSEGMGEEEESMNEKSCMSQFYRKNGEEVTLLFISNRAAWERLLGSTDAHVTEIVTHVPLHLG